LHLPPLRERTEDIVPLADLLLERHVIPDAPAVVLTMDLTHAIETYPWIGNVPLLLLRSTL
jgi:transcriptional regulator with PAS, ATPase and Fis domain